MPWLTANSDVRSLLNDGPTDHRAYRKRVLNRLDGTNKRFKTEEWRRLSNFKTDAGPAIGVFKNGVRLDQATEINSDDVEIGEFEVTTAPVDGDILECTYYFQWFLDTEIDGFLRKAVEWLNLGTDPDNVPPGLQPAASYYAVQEAYHKLCSKYASLESHQFRLEDAPDPKTKTPVDYYRMLANDARKKAEELRKGYYEGAGEQYAANFASIPGAVPRVQPKR